MAGCNAEPGARLAQSHLSADFAQVAAASEGYCDGERTDVIPYQGHFTPGPPAGAPYLKRR